MATCFAGIDGISRAITLLGNGRNACSTILHRPRILAIFFRSPHNASAVRGFRYCGLAQCQRQALSVNNTFCRKRSDLLSRMIQGQQAALIAIRDRNGTVVTLERDANRNLTRAISPLMQDSV